MVKQNLVFTDNLVVEKFGDVCLDLVRDDTPNMSFLEVKHYIKHYNVTWVIVLKIP